MRYCHLPLNRQIDEEIEAVRRHKADVREQRRLERQRQRNEEKEDEESSESEDLTPDEALKKDLLSKGINLETEDVHWVTCARCGKQRRQVTPKGQRPSQGWI